MSSRVLRKLQAEKQLVDEISDTETETPVGGARKKQLNINRYDLLNQQSHSESEVKEDDNETEAPKSCDDVNLELKRKKRKKKKKTGKYVSAQRSSEDNVDIDEVERSVREVNKLLGETYDPNVRMSTVLVPQKCDKNGPKDILHVQHKHLNPNNELKRIFGSKIVQSEHKRKNRGSRSYTKAIWMSNCKENLPQVGKSGIAMNLLETKDGAQYFAYEHSQSYRTIQNKFYEAVESLNPNNIVAIIKEHPYHIDALIQLSDLSKLSDDYALAAKIIERALYCLESAFHPLFNVAQGNCRLDYKRQENRALYITAFKHLIFLGGRACCRTSLEFCKLILSMDPDGDPLAVVLCIDFYALRAREYIWLKEFATEWETYKNLSQLPNFAFSNAVAHFYTCNGDTKKADSLLQEALIMFPGVLKSLLDKCSIQPDNRVVNHHYFSTENKDSLNLQQLINLYVHRSYHIWKDSDLLPWLEKNVQEVLDRVDAKEVFIQQCEEKRSKRYQGPLPVNIARHIILSDFKGLSPVTTDENTSQFGFDPFPPKDSINIYNRPKKMAHSSQAANPMVVFVRSLLPNFNPIIVEQEAEEGAGAAALPENEGGHNGNDPDFRRTVATMLGAMRHLLNNIRPEGPNDADIDENDETDEDDLT